MELIDSLTKKAQQAAMELIQLKKERRETQDELEYLRKQVDRLNSISRENDKLKRDRDLIRGKLLKLQKKIDKHLLVESTLAAQSHGGSR